MPHCGHTQLLTASPTSLSSHPSRLAPEHACLVHPHLGVLLHPPWVHEASSHV